MSSKKSRALIILGCCCIFAAAALYAHNSWESSRAGKQSDDLTGNLTQLLEQTQPAPDALSSDPVMDELMEVVAGTNQPKVEQVEPSASPSPSADSGTVVIKAYNINNYDLMGSISIPSVSINMAVIAQWSYDNLKASVCRYSGSPDTQMVILGHSYATHFGKLTDVAVGDEVTFTDVENNVYNYQVTGIEEIVETDLRSIITGDWDLTLFTCNYTGDKRICVRCDLIEK